VIRLAQKRFIRAINTSRVLRESLLNLRARPDGPGD
jgi:hypothetical protein